MKLSKKLKFVAFALLVFGVLGLFSGAFDIFAYFAEQSILENDSSINSTQSGLQDSISKLNENYPSWYSNWSLIYGLSKFLISVLFIFAGVSLLKVKGYAIKLVYASLSLSILLAVVKAAIFVSSGNSLLMVQLIKVPLSVLIDIILVIVATVSSKAYLELQHERI